MSPPIRGILFDKDGTLFDFDATWVAWAKVLLADISGGDDALAARLAACVGYDPQRGAFEPSSPAIAGTPAQLAAALAPVLGWSEAHVTERINASAAIAPMTEVTDLKAFLTSLSRAGFALGVATNDAMEPTLAHLDKSGIREAFDFIAASDGAFTPKPDPAMCLGFAKSVGLAPAQIAMVGDSLHDLHAGRAAGMATVAVLTGLAEADELAPHADAVLPDISHLPNWLAKG